MAEFARKVALVTGAGSGIGKASAVLLARRGAAVGVLADNAREIDETAREIEEADGRALPLCADVSDAAAMRGAIDRLASEYGRLDVVFANAGINGVWAPIDELEPEDWDRTIAVNQRGTFLTLRYAVPHLKAAGGGAIVVCSSINGTRSFSNAGTTAYSATKAAQVAMMRVLALELAPHGIRVNAVCPGWIDTQIDDNTWPRNLERAEYPVSFPKGEIPLTGGRPGSSVDVAELVAFLASDRARHITGSPVWIDAGESILV